MPKKLLWIINVDFDATVVLLIIYSVFVTYLGRNGNRVKQFISSLYISRKRMIHLGGRSCKLLSLNLVSPWNWQG